LARSTGWSAAWRAVGGGAVLAAADHDAHGRRVRAALAAVLVRADAPELCLVREWLDSWSGIDLIIAGMTRQGWDVQLTTYAARDWRANFFPVGIAHSIVGGMAWQRTPWRAVQRAAWGTLMRARETTDEGRATGVGKQG
jgi:hypothetical protein